MGAKCKFELSAWYIMYTCCIFVYMAVSFTQIRIWRLFILTDRLLFYLYALSRRERQLLLDSNMFLWTARFLEYVYLQGSADWEVIRSINLGIVV